MGILKLAEVGDRPVLESLLNAYLTELRTLVHGDWDPAAYPWIELQWSELGRYPFIILHEGTAAGLALIRCPLSTKNGLHQVAEFYLAPQHRGQGLAAHAATTLFKRFPGKWELTAHEQNDRAIAFWTRVIASVTQQPMRQRRLHSDDATRIHFLFSVN